jgi:hypothetical protein
MFRVLTFLLFSIPILTAWSSDNPVCDASPKTFFGTNSTGDVGCFKHGEQDWLILRTGNKNTAISRFRSAFGNKYRIWDMRNDSILPIKTRASFDSALVNFGNRAPDKDWCEIVEDPWSEWAPVSGETPDSCGVHSFAIFRNCATTGKAQKPCPDTCPTPEEFQTITVDNGDCEDCTDTSIYYTDTGIEASAYAATCPVGDSFLATNCEGEPREFPCEKASCDYAGEWVYSHCYNPPESQGHTIKYYTNQCRGDQIEETFYCSTPFIGLYCCKRSDS